MGYKININVNKILAKQKGLMKKKLNVYTDKIKESIDEKTPEDTKELIGNTQRSEVIDNGTKLHSRVFNNTDYAVYVEYGVQGKQYQYKKNGKNLIKRVGAGMFAITKEELGDKFNELTK